MVHISSSTPGFQRISEHPKTSQKGYHSVLIKKRDGNGWLSQCTNVSTSHHLGLSLSYDQESLYIITKGYNNVENGKTPWEKLEETLQGGAWALSLLFDVSMTSNLNFVS